MEDRNQFKKLRFDNDNAFNTNISQRDLAEQTGLGFSTISKIEKEGCDTAAVSTIKAYRNYFKDKKQETICYDYLMGEVATRDIKYHALGELFPFDDAFYNNLEELLKLDAGNHFIERMLSALLHHPEALFTELITVFNALYKINHIQQDKTLSASEKTEMVKVQEYIFNQSTIEFLEGTIMPVLQRGFQERDAQLSAEAEHTQEQVQELSPADDPAATVTVTIMDVSPIQNEPE